MKRTQLIILCLVLFSFRAEAKNSTVQNLTVIEQDYSKALKIAVEEDKLLLIDFYTTWCAPCKKLDRLVFRNDSIQRLLKDDFVLLKYDAENDTVYHLSKKHHISSYPAGIILTKNGQVITREYGFPGDDFQSLTTSVLDFTNRGLKLNEENKTIVGYSKNIDASKYPSFYTDFVNRTIKKVDSEELNQYWKEHEDIFSEEYFSTLFYFTQYASESVADLTLKNKDRYLEFYGKKDVEILLYFFVRSRFSKAIANKSRKEYGEAIVFANNALTKRWLDDVLPSAQKDFLIAQNKWKEVLEINERLKNKGRFPSGAINHFSWNVYKKCNDDYVIAKCLDWMDEVTQKEPSYAFLDTYAFLLYKSGKKEETKRITLLAIEAAKVEGMKTKSLENLLDKL